MQVEKSGPEGQGRRYPPALPLVSRGLYVVFLDEGSLKVDVSLAGEWFAEAVDQLIHADVDEDDVPFLLFLCGAEAALRTQEQRDEVLH